jgi:branched-chain amino acid transport system substrate-binding protein
MRARSGKMQTLSMKEKMTFRQLLILASTVFAAFGVGTSVAESPSWRVGVMVCLSGACAESGRNSLEGVQLAVDEINSKGGVLGHQVDLKVEDTVEGTSSGAGAVSAFRKLLEDSSIHFLIGPSWTPGGLSVAPIAAKRSDIILTSPSLGVADFDRAGDNIFNLWPHDEDATRNLASFALTKGWKRVAVFSSQQPWELLQGTTFSDEFARQGGHVVVKVEPLPTQPDLRAEALRIRSAKPDAVFLSNFTQMGVGAKQLRDLGYKGPLFAILMDDTRIETSAGALDDSIYSGYPAPDPGFSTSFRARYHKEPGIGADTAYDTMKLYAWAVTEAGTFDPGKVKSTIQSATLPGASGIIRFDKFGGVKKDPVLYVVRGKEKVRYNG